jgi:hypothetical protein
VVSYFLCGDCIYCDIGTNVSACTSDIVGTFYISPASANLTQCAFLPIHSFPYFFKYIQKEVLTLTYSSDFIEPQNKIEATQIDEQVNDGAVQLRLDYTNLELLSPFAKEYERIQNNCSINTLAITRQRPFTGLGSDIHVYSTSMCKAIELNSARLRTVGSWIWNSIEHCPIVDIDNNTITTSPMLCYFPKSETVCPNDDNDDNEDMIERVNLTDLGGLIDVNSCPNVTEQYGGTSAIRAATTEYLFTRVADFVVKEAERQLQILFGNNTSTNNKVPDNLITVHIRWGDKQLVMGLLPMERYINAVHKIVNERKIARNTTVSSNADDEQVHIYLSTEDPKAVEQFMSTKPSHWNVYLDQYYVEMIPYRHQFGDEYGGNSNLVKLSQGRSGVIAMGSLLVAMEAKDYVLTTASNWSRLMNEIRKNIIDPRCQFCTSIVDLLSWEYR